MTTIKRRDLVEPNHHEATDEIDVSVAFFNSMVNRFADKNCKDVIIKRLPTTEIQKKIAYLISEAGMNNSDADDWVVAENLVWNKDFHVCISLYALEKTDQTECVNKINDIVCAILAHVDLIPISKEAVSTAALKLTDSSELLLAITLRHQILDKYEALCREAAYGLHLQSVPGDNKAHWAITVKFVNALAQTAMSEQVSVTELITNQSLLITLIAEVLTPYIPKVFERHELSKNIVQEKLFLDNATKMAEIYAYS